MGRKKDEDPLERARAAIRAARLAGATEWPDLPAEVTADIWLLFPGCKDINDVARLLGHDAAKDWAWLAKTAAVAPRVQPDAPVDLAVRRAIDNPRDRPYWEDPGFVADGEVPVDRKAERERRSHSASEAGPLSAIEGSEDATAEAFSKRFADRFLRRTDIDQWVAYDGERGVWIPDAGGSAVGHAMRGLTKELAIGLDKPTPALLRNLSSARHIDAALRLAARDPRHAISGEAFDLDNDLLQTPAGIVHLPTGKIRPHDPGMRHTRSTSVAPGRIEDAPSFTAFLEEILAEPDGLGPDRDTIEYVQRFAGYCLSGDMSEQKIHVFIGPGGTGKSTLVNALLYAMGSYGTTLSAELFTQARGERHPVENTQGDGPRVGVVPEIPTGAKMDEAKAKAWSGGDAVTARHIRGAFYVYRSKMKILMVGNHMFGLQTVDPAMTRRLRRIDFLHTPRQVDERLPARLRLEAPGILAWCVEGYRLWLKDGLKPSSSISSRTEEYFKTEDAFGDWIGIARQAWSDLIEVDRKKVSRTLDLYDDWVLYAKRRGEFPRSFKWLSLELEQRGFERGVNGANQRGFHGLAPGVRTADDGSEAAQGRLDDGVISIGRRRY